MVALRPENRVLRRRRRGGFSLIELLLAMTILLGSIAVLGELARLGRRSGGRAAELTEAQLLCESVLAELVAGSLPLEEADGQAFEQSPGWVYSVERTPLEVPGLVAVRVVVSQDLPEEQRPLSFALSRWLRDDAALSTAPAGVRGAAAAGGTP